MVLKEIISTGSVPYSGSHNNNSTWVSLPDILSSFMLENTLSAMYVDWNFPHLSLVMCYITPTYASSVQELIMQRMQQKI